MTISLLTLLTPPGKVASSSRPAPLKPDTLLIDETLARSFGDQLTAQQCVAKALLSSKSEPKSEAIDDQDPSEPTQATTLLNLVVSMLPTKASLPSPTLSPSMTGTKPDSGPASLSAMNSAHLSSLTLSAKKSELQDTRIQSSTQQPAINTTPTSLAPAMAQLLSQPALTVPSPANERLTPHPPALTQPNPLPELAIQPASAQELKAPLGSLQWQRDLSQQIIFHKQGQHTIHLKLHPEELGDVKISMTVNKDHAELIMFSNHGQVRSALEAALPQLRQALADNGIQLGNSQVGHDSASGQQSAFSSNPSPTQPKDTLIQVESHELSSATETAPTLLREGSQISLLV